MKRLEEIKPEAKRLWREFIPGFADYFGSVWEYFTELWSANQRVNLFSRKAAPLTVWRDQIIDSALGLPFFADLHIPSHVVDFGSGGGLPGIIIALCLPALRLSLVEKSAKKRYYVGRIVERLAPGNVSLHATLSEVDPWRVLTVRAVGRIPEVMSQVLADRSDVTDTHILFYKARKTVLDDELAAFTDDRFQVSVLPLSYPDGEKERHLVWLAGRTD